MAEKKITRKELLKEPDEFLSTSGQVVEFARKNPGPIKVAITAVLLAVLSGAAIYYYMQQKEVRSHELLEAAYRQYEVTIAGEPGKEQLDTLFAQFDSIAKDYPGYLSGDIAKLYCGHVLYKKGDFKGALDNYNSLRSSKLEKLGFTQLVQYHIATTRFALHEYDQALVGFDQLSKDTNSPYRREAHASVARIYEAMGKNKEAVQAYRQYLKMFPEAPDAAFMKARIADLAVQG